jgi:hypothetical protein
MLTNAAICTCLPKQVDYNSYFAKHNPENSDTGQTGFLQFLNSATNNTGARKISDEIAGVPGKTRTVRFQYNKPVCIQVCKSTSNCGPLGAGTINPIECVDYSLPAENFKPCAPNDVLELTADAMAGYCNINDPDFFKEMVMKRDDLFVKQLDAALVKMLKTDLIPATSVVTLPFHVTNSTTNQTTLNEDVFFWISEEMAKQAIFGDYVLFGGTMINRIKHKLKVATASTIGVDVRAIAGQIPPLYYDKNFDAEFGTNAVVAIPYNVLQFITWTENRGHRAFSGDGKLIKSVRGFQLGNGSTLEYDYQWEFEPHCGNYRYQPSSYMDLVKAICGGCLDVPAAQADCGLKVFKDCTPLVLPVC